MSLTELQEKVFKEAKNRLQKESWYRGVCVDNFPSHSECEQDFDGCVSQVIINTEYWDNW